MNRDITGTYKTLIKKINSSKQKIISIDIPSGVNGDTGESKGIAIKADRTLILHAKKNSIPYLIIDTNKRNFENKD